MATSWQTRFAEYLKRMLALRESTALEVLGDLMPTFPVIAPGNPEHHAARGEVLISAHGQVAAAAGQFPTVWVGLPATVPEGTILVIDRIIVASPTSQDVTFLPTSNTLPAPVACPTDDERIPNARSLSRLSTSSEVTVFVGTGGRRTIVAASTPLVVPMRFVLGPGKVLSAQGNTAATRLVAWFQGYERQALPDEFRV